MPVTTQAAEGTAPAVSYTAPCYDPKEHRLAVVAEFIGTKGLLPWIGGTKRKRQHGTETNIRANLAGDRSRVRTI